MNVFFASSSLTAQRASTLSPGIVSFRRAAAPTPSPSATPASPGASVGPSDSVSPLLARHNGPWVIAEVRARGRIKAQ